MKKIYAACFAGTCLLCLLSSCTPSRALKKIGRDMEHSPVFSRAFTGFELRDAETGRILLQQNGYRHFTPASNTKILTLYTCLHVLKDSLPGLEVLFPLHEEQSAGGFFTGYAVRGTGDPTLLHPKFDAWQAPFRFMQQQMVMIQDDPALFPQPRFGAGWSWDDYSDYYSPELTPMPAYGNVLRARRNNWSFDVYPRFFQDSLYWKSEWDKKQPGIERQELSNQLDARLSDHFPNDYEREIPIFQARKLLQPLLADTLPEVYTMDFPWDGKPPIRVIYSAPVDTVYRRMMYESDNFFADQLLLMCAREKFGVMQHARIISWVQDSLFDERWGRPRWVDGSGLSRYNLVTPHFLTEILLRMWREQEHQRLLSLFPAGGRGGTIANLYAGTDGQPYVFAKTGSMSGVHCLSGYVKGQSGRVFVFSFMHNNFVGSNAEWKKEMQHFLEKIHQKL